MTKLLARGPRAVSPVGSTEIYRIGQSLFGQPYCGRLGSIEAKLHEHRRYDPILKRCINRNGAG